MITALWAQIALTMLFVATGGYSLVRAVRGRGVRTRVGMFAHAAMSAAMIAMVWPFGAALPIAVQLVVFGAATVWFLVVAVVDLRRPRAARAAGHSVIATFFHAGMMAAMCWMLVAMAPADAGSSVPQAGMSQREAGHAGMDHAGTDHGAMDRAAMGHTGMEHGTMDHTALPGGLVVVGIVVLVVLVAGAAVLAADLLTRRRAPGAIARRHRADDAAAVVMALGMAATTVPLVLAG